MKRILLILSFLLLAQLPSIAQCAMCRATLENNISNGNIGIAAGINVGILYLFFAPYFFILLIGFFWYRTSRKNARKNFEPGAVAR